MILLPLRIALVRPNRTHSGFAAGGAVPALAASVVLASLILSVTLVVAPRAPAATVAGTIHSARVNSPRLPGAGELRTALEAYPPPGPEGSLTTERTRAAGASAVKIVVSWNQIAPATPAPGFDPANPFDPGYDWSELDREVNLAAGSGLEPFVVLFGAPRWAEGGPDPSGAGIDVPDPAQLELFARAAALRYDGTHPGLPRVRVWGVWNEPNVSFFMLPQFQAGKPASIARYREMVNGVSAAVKGVHPDNLVIAGELFPNGIMRPEVQAVAPLVFLRALFCLSAGSHPRRTCRTRVDADIVGVHPYSSGGPSDHPADSNNVWIGNLSSMGTLIAAAQRLGNLVSSGPVGFWVTEFGWNTKPPRSAGVPVALDARWIAEALYRMSRSGVSLATYFGLRDNPSAASIFHTGLYYGCAGGIQCDVPKPSLAAFRFPFVAYTTSRKREVVVWGRTPAGVQGSVQVQSSAGSAWRRLTVLRTDGDGIFAARLRLPGSGPVMGLVLRAVLSSASAHSSGSTEEASPGFSLTRPPDLLVSPFG
jgi:hypothetical protein